MNGFIWLILPGHITQASKKVKIMVEHCLLVCFLAVSLRHAQLHSYPAWATCLGISLLSVTVPFYSILNQSNLPQTLPQMVMI